MKPGNFDNAVISPRDLARAMTKGAKKVKLFQGVRIITNKGIPDGVVIFRSGRCVVGIKGLSKGAKPDGRVQNGGDVRMPDGPHPGAAARRTGPDD